MDSASKDKDASIVYAKGGMGAGSDSSVDDSDDSDVGLC